MLNIHFDLHFMLNVVKNAYTMLQNFCRRVLDSPIKEINEKTQYKISYTKFRRARRITGFNFTMDCSQVMPDEKAAEPVQIEKALQERHLNITAKRLLEDHGISVTRFIEFCCQEK